MALASASGSNSLEHLKQQIFTRLAFLGMLQGDATKFVDLSMKVVASGTEGKSARGGLKKALSRVLGKPRAELFVKWLMEKILDLSTSRSRLSAAASAQPSESKGQSAARAVVQQPEPPTCPQSKGVKSEQPPQQAFSTSETSTADRLCTATDKMVLEQLNKLCAPANEIVIDEAWVEVKSKAGKTYFWNRSSNSCSWALPDGVSAKWISHKSAEGRTYYYDRDGCVVWVMPPLQATTSKESSGKISLVQPHSLAKSFALDAAVSSADPETPVLEVPQAGSRPSGSEPTALPEMKAAMELSSTETSALGVPLAAIATSSTAPETPQLTRKLANTSENTRDCEKICEHQPQDSVPVPTQPQVNKSADGTSLRGRSRSPRRGLSPDAKLKLARKIAALKQRSSPVEWCPSDKSAPRSKLEQNVFEFQRHRQASTGGA